MLFDLFASLTAPCSPHIRALGYLDETLAMRRRHLRNGKSWQAHLDNTRRFVLSAAEESRKKNRLVIVGSGLLLDVPLEELAGMFREILLKDVVCLPEVRKRIKKYGNVTFIEQDVTNLAERLFEGGKQVVADLPEAGVCRAVTDEADLVVSLNILSQLWVIPRSFAVRRLRHIPPERIEEWCREIVEAHYTRLRSLSCDVCLVADFEQVKRDRGGNVITRSSTVYDLSLPGPDETWTWNIVPLGKDSPHTSKELIVGAWFMPRQT